VTTRLAGRTVLVAGLRLTAGLTMPWATVPESPSAWSSRTRTTISSACGATPQTTLHDAATIPATCVPWPLLSVGVVLRATRS